MENSTYKPKIESEGLDLQIDKNSFGLQLRTWRLRNGLTQREVGQRFGCSRFTIIRAENGQNITWEMAYRLFAHLSKELQKEGQQQ